MMFDRCRHIEVRDAGLGVTAQWDGGVTAVLLDESSRVLGRRPLGDAPTTAEVETVLRGMIHDEGERRRASNLVDRARSAAQRSWAVSGAARALIDQSRRLTAWRGHRRWTELEPGDRNRHSA